MDIRYDSRKKINGQCGKGWREGPEGKCIRNRNGDFSRALYSAGKEGLRKDAVDVKATRVDSSDDAKCDLRAGWVRGPGGKCVRKKKSGIKRGLATLGLIGAAGLVGADLLSKKAAGTMPRERSKPGHNTVYVMPDNAVARARRRAGAINVTATRVDAEYALGYLAGKGVEYHGDNPVGYLYGFLQFRKDATRPECDPEKGWVRGPRGKCVRKKKGDSSKPRVNLGHLGFVGGAVGAVAGASLLRRQQQKKQEEIMNSMRSTILKNIEKRNQKRSSGAGHDS